jgi:hypothetical protein
MKTFISRFTQTLVILILALSALITAPASPVRANGPDPDSNPDGVQVEGLPAGFYLIKSAPGVNLYQKNYLNGQPDFVQVINLSQGATVKLNHGGIVNAGLGLGPWGGNNPTINRTSLLTAWNSLKASSSLAFCSSNGAFFSVQDPAPLAFSLKKDNIRVADGYGSATEYPGQLLMLELWANKADIRTLNKANLVGSTAPNILGGLSEYADKSMNSYVGRTFAGIDDTNLDGIYETVLLFNTLYSRQVDAATVLRSFGADKIIMFDGGGSSQLICQDTSLVPSSRTIPQTIAVLSSVNASCPAITAWKGLYWNNQTLYGPAVLCRNETGGVAYNWGTSSPAAGIPTDHFSARFTANLTFTSGRFRFHLKGDDGMALYVDGVRVINGWRDQGSTEYTADLTLGKGPHALQVDYYENTGEASVALWWEDLTSVVFSSKPAFDACYLPAVAKMQTWWNTSPYFEANIYMGGNNRGCNSWNLTYLNATWVSQVRAQGWNLIPTWVGPQASCTTRALNKMSADPATAYLQGRAEADAASLAAKNLGLTVPGTLNGTIIYYDMEAYPSTCRTVVKKFLSGWVDRLRELGNRSGIYGSGCSSYLTDMASGASIPDAIWAAHWIYPTFNNAATAFGVACLSDTLWTNSRLRQYTGGHTETWGGIALGVDSDISNGFVAGRTPRAPGAPAPVAIQAAQVISANQALLVYPDRLLRTGPNFSGRTVITPAMGSDSLRAAFFLDAKQGWALSASMPDQHNFSSFRLFRTSDQGATWKASDLPYQPQDGSSTQGNTSIFFLTPKIGWISFQMASSSSFDGATILHTTDGGQTWRSFNAPAAGRMYFSTPARGFILSASTGTLYTTLNAGKTWKITPRSPRQADEFQPALLMSSRSPFLLNFNGSSLQAGREGDQHAIRLPQGVTEGQFIDWNTGWVHASTGTCQGTKSADENSDFSCQLQDAFQFTNDGGQTWQVIEP